MSIEKEIKACKHLGSLVAILREKGIQIKPRSLSDKKWNLINVYQGNVEVSSCRANLRGDIKAATIYELHNLTNNKSIYFLVREKD